MEYAMLRIDITQMSGNVDTDGKNICLRGLGRNVVGLAIRVWVGQDAFLYREPAEMDSSQKRSAQRRGALRRGGKALA